MPRRWPAPRCRYPAAADRVGHDLRVLAVEAGEEQARAGEALVGIWLAGVGGEVVVDRLQLFGIAGRGFHSDVGAAQGQEGGVLTISSVGRL